MGHAKSGYNSQMAIKEAEMVKLTPIRGIQFGFIALVMLALGSVAMASPHDIQLRGLGRPQTNSLDDPAVKRFRLLTSELALALAPKPLSPAETLGVSGFEFSIGSSHADISEDLSYWQGQPGSPIFEAAIRDRKIPGMLWIPYIHLRKGLPTSTEIGINGSYLAGSNMFMVGADFKIALHESYIRWFPSISVRAAASTLFGAGDFVVTTGEADLIVSLPIGIGGMVRINPYLAFGLMGMDATSDVIDETPYDVRDQGGGPSGSLYTYPRMKLTENLFKRLVIGTQVQTSFIKLLYEIDVGQIGFADKVLMSHTFQVGFDA